MISKEWNFCKGQTPALNYIVDRVLAEDFPLSKETVSRVIAQLVLKAPDLWIVKNGECKDVMEHLSERLPGSNALLEFMEDLSDDMPYFQYECWVKRH